MSFLIALFTSFAFAGTMMGGAVQGTLFSPGGTPVTSSGVNFKVQVLDKNGTCVLYEESHLGVDLSQTNGDFSFDLGSGTARTNFVSNTSSLDVNVYRNDVTPLTVTGCSPLTVAADDERTLRVQFDVGSGLIALSPDLKVQGSVYAAVAATVQGKSASDLLQVHYDGSGNLLNQNNLNNIFSGTNYPALTALLAGTSTQYLPTGGTAPVNINGNRLINVAAPGTSPLDGVNKGYADSFVAGRVIDTTAIGAGIGGGSTIVWDQAANKWVAGAASFAPSGPAGGDLTGAYPNPTIKYDAITSAKINSTGIAVNRLLITDATTGANVTYATCLPNEILKWTATGWACGTVATLAPVTSVAGKTGAVTLNAADIAGLGTVVTKDYGSAAGEVPLLGTGGRLPASMLPSNVLLNGGNAFVANVGIGTTTPQAGLDIATTGTGGSALLLPRDTTANRPSVPVNGMIRYNSSTGAFEGYVSGAWGGLATGAAGQWNYGTASTINYTAGYVGVGKANPTAVLDVADEARVSSAGTAYVTLYGAQAQILSNAGGMKLISSGSNATSFETNGAERMRVSSSGNVGIGTNNPTTRLYVYGTSGAQSTTATFASNPGFGAADMANEITLDNTNGTNAQNLIAFRQNGATHFQLANDVDGTGALNFGLYDYVGSSLRWIVDSKGRFGVGTNGPQAALDVALNGTLASAIIVPRDSTANRPSVAVNGMIRYNSATNRFEAFENGVWANMIAAGGGTTSFPLLASPGTTTASAPSYSFASNTSTGLYSPGVNQLALATSGTAAVTVLANGNVGVGSGSPASRLDVAGAISINGLNAISYPANDSSAGGSLAVGAGALAYQSALGGSGNYWNTAVGFNTLGSPSMTSATTGNTAVGFAALSSNTGAGNTAVGAKALLSNTTGGNNTAVGRESMSAMQTGSYNVAVGEEALWSGTSGSSNVAVGASAMLLGGAGSDNVAVGANAAWSATAISKSVYIGSGAGRSSTSVVGNVLLGYQAGYDLTTGSNNIVLGSYPSTAAGLTTGSNNILIGQDVRPAAQTGSNQLNIGNLIYASGLGIAGTASAGSVGIGTSSPQAGLDVATAGAASAILIPRDTTVNRPTGVNGMIRYNSSLAAFEGFSNGAWGNLASSGTASAQWSYGTSGQIYYSGGNVGVGTSTPAAPFHVSLGGAALPAFNPGNGEGFVFSKTAGPGDWARMFLLGGQSTSGMATLFFGNRDNIYGSSIGSVAGADLVFSSNNAQRMRLDANGSLGIGINSPQAGLDVATTGTLASAIIVPRDTTANRPSVAVNGMIRYSTSSNKFEAFENGGWTNVISAGSGVPAGANNTLQYNNGGAFGGAAFVTVNTASKILNVGDIAGASVAITNSGGTSSWSGLSIVESNLADGNAASMLIGKGSTTNNASVIAYVPDATAANSALQFSGYGHTTPTLTVTHGTGLGAGYVGVGTASPAYSLDVNGSLRASGKINVNATSYADVNVFGNGTVYQNGADAFTRVQATGSGNARVILQSNGPAGGASDAGHEIGRLDFGGYNGSAWVDQSAAIKGLSESTWTASNYASAIAFSTSQGTTMSERLRINSSGLVGIGTASPAAGLDIATTGTLASAIIIPRDTTANRPATAVNGMIRYNTSTAAFEGYQNGGWMNLIAGTGTGSMSLFSDGNSSSPSIAFANQPTTGFYRFGNAIGVATLGTSTYGFGPGVISSLFTGGGSINMTGSTVTSPAYAFAGDTATGVHTPGAGRLALVTSGTARLSIDASGNVGIGTSTPTGKLSLEMPEASGAREVFQTYVMTGDANTKAGYANSTFANGLFAPMFYAYRSGTADKYVQSMWGLTDAAGDLAQTENALVNVAGLVSDNSADPINGNLTNPTNRNIFSVSSWNGPMMVVGPTGNLGVGTISPKAGLDVATTGAASAIIVPRDTTGNRPSTALNGMIRYNTSTAAFEGYSNGAWGNLASSGTASAQWTYGTSGQIYYNGGNVGIGTNNPTSRFQVDHTTTLTSGGASNNPVMINLTTQPAAASSATSRAVYGYNYWSGAVASPSANVVGVSGASESGGAITIGAMTGVDASAGNTGSGTASSSTGVAGYVTNSGTGTTTSATAGMFWVTRSAGTITNGYGVYIGTIDANSKYSLYATDANAPSYFAGKVGIGTNTPQGALDVAGTGTGASALIVPRDTQANRPSISVNGMIRYNTSNAAFEGYQNGGWMNLIAGTGTGSMSLFIDGTSSSPSIAFANQPTTGFYRFGNAIGVATLGTSTYGFGPGVISSLFTGGGSINMTGSTVSAPAYAFSGDTATGLHTPGAGRLALVTSGTARLSIDASGNVGIATSTPSEVLDVNGSINVPYGNYLKSNGSGFANSIMLGTYWDGASDHLTIQPAGNSASTISLLTAPNTSTAAIERVRIGSDGNVGIGTGVPQSGLDVSTTGTLASAIIVPRDSTANRPSTAVNGMLRYNTSTAAFEGYANGAWGGLASGGSNLWSNGTSGQIYYNSGNVGVGTSSPVSKLHVVGGIRSEGAGFLSLAASDPAAPVAAPFMSAQASSGFSTSPAYSFWYQSGTGIANPAVDTIALTTAGTTRLSVLPSGSVGIGIASPWTDFMLYRADATATASIVSDNTSTTTARYPMISVKNFGGTGTSTLGTPAIELVNLRGNSTTSQVMQSGDALGAITFNGATSAATAYKSGAEIRAFAAETYSGSANGGALAFSTTGTGSQTLTERMRIDATGKVGIGILAPTSAMHLKKDQGAATEIAVENMANNINTYAGFLGTTDAGSFAVGMNSVAKGAQAYMWTSSNVDMIFGVNNGVKMTLRPTGALGIGTPTPTTMLQVNGAIASTAVSNSGVTIDFSTGNLQYTSASCGAMNLWNLKSGATYQLAVQGTAGGTCAFTVYSDSGSSTLTLKANPTNMVQDANTHMLYSLSVMGAYVYVTSANGF